MQRENESRKVIGVEVEPHSSKRTVRMRLILENDEVLNVEMPLPTATRLTDQLVDAEFNERYTVGMGPLTRDVPLEVAPNTDVKSPAA
jgi:hypothetical protein